MKTAKVTPESTSDATPSVIRRALRTTRNLIAAFIVLSAVTFIATFFLNHYAPALVNSTVWTRSFLVLVDSVVAMLYAVRASRGLTRAHRNLRLLAAGSLVAVVVLVVLPGLLPGWMKLEQALCGLLLLGVVVNVNRRKVRALFASAPARRAATSS
jgi:peptidoglycan/LPS O-acetylase OafA/YrhL